jgi:hypothetical protein
MLRVLGAGLLVIIGALALSANERSLRSAPQNYEGAPVVARASTALLKEESVASKTVAQSRGALVSTGSSEQGSRFVSAAGTASSGSGIRRYTLRGDVRCWNKSAKDAQTLGMLVVPLDRDHNPLSAGRSNIVVVNGPLRGGETDSLRWETASSTAAAAVEEVAIAILMIQFADGTVWEAPTEERVDYF